MATYFRKTARFGGKKYEATGKTELEAALKLQKKLEAAEAGAVNSTTTVDRWFEEWMDLYRDHKDITDKSRAMYRQKYYGQISPRIGRMKLKDVRDTHLQRIMNAQQGASFSHASKVRMVLQAMFKQARRSRLIPFDPAEDIKLPAVKVGKRRSLTEKERAAFLEVAKSHPAGLLILTMLYTGMRNGELAALTWSDIDFNTRDIHVHSAVESGSTRIKTPKTDAGIRDIYIRDELLPLLEAAAGAPEAPVFPNAKGQHMDEDTIQRRWRSFKRAVDIHMGATVRKNKIIEHKLDQGLTMYCLRHTFATDCEKAGVPINVAKEILGHSDISVTANIYTHKDNSIIHKKMGNMGVEKEEPVEKPVETVDG